ncbi:Dihydrolipoamide acyltransferase component of branched-chain alpha-keto acid dehydrogenase complex [Brachybacterium faecium]|uniref:Dihydrolipoamide acetyltransferase component of pyruvate dehydrogenase complex n=1 Tax=Brachybacterium faecium (strain ATCC 43885 / DSM 4810 / JCM 11609 / LMG 19847 / NBRC 14762 / NCIMB 9860 / 6-10) TaxID=446465 RepID=C7MD13_BRAFD|nr:2-oxoglutarate dehydrogenase, E2 component, dihydrolipoamide succinyltransferase [Brachybacterium faecium]ACU85470.1 2-oxoglutarate dehydrogenase E2 component [Brachybacterium faecium DSM 4810]SLM95699.1 Dihydrolipoamide acyltransferase component of branched-chain alpha-keto acid dehydrogenase complex [Brachybacterium faecium]
MSETVKMPALGESVTEGTVTRWLKSVGDTVEVDEPLLEVSTDKVDTEIPSPIAGTIEEILVEEDDDAEVGADLVVIGDGSGSESSDSGDSGAEETSQEEAPAESEDLASDDTVAPSTDDEAPAGESEKPAEGESSASSGEPGGAASGEDVTMPALGESVTEGTVTRWLKEVGDSVEVDEPLLEVSTDKVDTEIPSPVAGTLLEIRVPEDEDAEVGSVLAVIGSGEAASAPAEEPSAPAPKAEEAPAKEAPKAEEKQAEAPKAEEKPAEETTEAPKAAEQKAQEPSAPAAAPKAADAVSGAESSGYVTPLVRKMANEAGVDLSTVKGSGLGGRIRKQDVQQAIDAQKSAAAAPASSAPAAAAAPAAPKVEVSSKRGTEEKMPRIRKVIGQRMMESLHEMAQLTTAVEVDLTRIAKLRARAKDDFAAREGAKLTYLPFLMMAAIEGLKTYPQLNSTIDGDKIVYHGSENIGMAADTERGLVVPVIKNAGDLNLAGLARQIGDLGSRAKGNKLVPDDLAGATFTITNTGSGGALWDTPIVPAPQVGILGTGTITKRPAVVQNAEGDDTIAIRSMMYLFLSYDHRMVDGGDAARFLTFMKKRLEEGAFEGELGL